MKGKGKGQGCFICGDPNHWSKECPKGKRRMSAVTEEEGQQEGNQKMRNGMVMNGRHSQDWIGCLDDWSGNWSWSEDDWNYWSDDWSWGSQDWWSAEQPNASASSGSQSTANVPQDPAKSEPSQNVAAVTVETQDQNAARPSRTVRGAKPGMMTNLFVGACLLIGALSAGVPPVPSRNVYLRMINWVVTTDWSSFTCKQDWWTSIGYCSTVELVRTVVRNGLLRTTLFCR